MPVWSKFKASLGRVMSSAFLGIAAATSLLKPFGTHVNPTTVALSFLLVVLFLATAWGSKPAVLASLPGVVCFNFFFLPPIGTLQIRNPDNWVAFFAFLITALTAGQLSARAKRRAEEAESAKQEIERPITNFRTLSNVRVRPKRSAKRAIEVRASRCGDSRFAHATDVDQSIGYDAPRGFVRN